MLSALMLFYLKDLAVPAVIAVWKLSQLVRSPQRLSLRWVVAFWVLGTVHALIAPFLGQGVDLGGLTVGPALGSWLNYLFPSVMVYCLACVFVFSAERGRAARSWAARQAVVLVLVLVVLAVIASGLSATGTGTHISYSVTATDLFGLVVETYCTYVLTVCVVWMRRYARLTTRWMAWGLTVAGAGLLIEAVFSAYKAVAMVLHLAGVAAPVWLAPPWMLRLADWMAIIGIVAPGAAVRWSAARIWWRHLRDYHRLRPLWSLLHQAFPDDALNRVPVSFWLDVLSLRSVNRRFYRRFVECRDGLVRVSGELGPEARPIGPAAVAVWLRRALDGGPMRLDGSAIARPIAIPVERGFDADVRELVALSRELRTV